MLPPVRIRQLLVVLGLVIFYISARAAERVVYHAVQPGETLTAIAERYGTTVQNLVAINELDDPDRIYAGQVLVVAITPVVHVVKSGENLWTIAKQYGVTVSAILLFNNLPDPDRLLPGQALTIPPAGGQDAVAVVARAAQQSRRTLLWPVQGGGIISSHFGPRSGSVHKGLDIAAPLGTPILAADGGRVTYAGWAGTYGMLVEIDHGGGVVTRYAHASAVHVEAGARVAAGQHIADVGSTGRSTGPHLHFEVEVNGEVVDPLTWLPARR